MFYVYSKYYFYFLLIFNILHNPIFSIMISVNICMKFENNNLFSQFSFKTHLVLFSSNIKKASFRYNRNEAFLIFEL